MTLTITFRKAAWFLFIITAVSGVGGIVGDGNNVLTAINLTLALVWGGALLFDYDVIEFEQ